MPANEQRRFEKIVADMDHSFRKTIESVGYPVQAPPVAQPPNQRRPFEANIPAIALPRFGQPRG